MKRILVFTALFLSAYVAIAQQPPAQPQGQTVTPKAPYDSIKAQLSVAREENFQLKANATQTAFQQQMKDFQAQYLAEETALTAWIADVKKSNGWDDTYAYDRAGDKWAHTPKAVTKSAEAPKK
jgi:hypothetical protein